MVVMGAGFGLGFGFGLAPGGGSGDSYWMNELGGGRWLMSEVTD
jgi:hypothetical protein